MAAISWWGIRDPWNSELAIDEFGPGTLDGNPADGSSYDACGPAAIENVAASYEKRLPNYSNIGSIRRDMIGNGEWTVGGTIQNPRTNGCDIGNVAWEVPRRGYVVVALHDYQPEILTEADIRTALAYRQALIFILTNAQALIYNETGVHGHFVAIATYSGDNADGTTGKVLILNSDVAGQHGAASGQWTPVATLIAAEPHGYVVIAPPPPPPPPEPAEDENVAGIIADLKQLQAAVAAGVADALAKLQEPAGG